MKTIHLIHNPGAGNEGYSKLAMINLLESFGYVCRYCSTDDQDWQNIHPNTDCIVIAGGDGTIKKVVSVLLKKAPVTKRLPIAVLPMGTANNIAASLNIRGKPEEIIRSWILNNTTSVDVGEITGATEPAFFIESFGYGLFPYLMNVMNRQNKNVKEDKDGRLKTALQHLHTISQSYQPHHCELIIDGEDHSGSFLMAEIMNTRFIGPNLFLSPHGDPGDGTFEVVLIPGEDQAKFAAYINSKLHDAEVVYSFVTIKAEDVQIKWNGTHVHVDDELLTLEQETPVHVKIIKDALIFLV